MGLIKWATSGTWWLRCVSDPRWDCSGDSEFVGGFTKPEECEAKLKKLKEKLGDPPEDLEWGYMKD